MWHSKLRIDFLHTWTDGHKTLRTNGTLTMCWIACALADVDYQKWIRWVRPIHCAQEVFLGSNHFGLLYSTTFPSMWAAWASSLWFLPVPGFVEVGQSEEVPVESWTTNSLWKSDAAIYATLNSIHCMLSQKQFSIRLTVRDNIAPASTNLTELYKFITLEFHGKCDHLPSALFVRILSSLWGKGGNQDQVLLMHKLWYSVVT